MKEALTNQDLTGSIANNLTVFTNNLKRPHGEYAPFGINIAPEPRKNTKFKNKPVSIKSNSLKLKGSFV